LKQVFGPVPSRRLGRSLGIDPVPLKTCNWNCVYCQLGRSVPMSNERKTFFPVSQLLSQVEETLRDLGPNGCDWLTLVGSGEPTLYQDLGELISGLKALSHVPVAVCTNGSLLPVPAVRQALRDADAVMPTVSAGSWEVYWRLHRPYPGLDFQDFVNALVQFRSEYDGNLWPEVMLVKGINDSKEALDDIAAVMDRIQPDRVFITVPTRPPAETWVMPPDNESLIYAAATLDRFAKSGSTSGSAFHIGEGEDICDAVLSIVSRHPMSQQELERTIAHLAPGEEVEVMVDLIATGRFQIVERQGTQYWLAAEARFPEADSSNAVHPERLRRLRTLRHRI
jgi:wyosine [tRNA(Phe)-imidazoG37] synthetase (radical SAM superfamily)